MYLYTHKYLNFRMTQFKPADRPSADVLLADPFIAEASTPTELAAFIKKLKDNIQLTI